MPADRRVILPVGTGGLNLRDAPPELAAGELVDSLNWRIDQNGALVKRLGVKEWSVPTPAAILELMVLAIASGSTWLLAHCTDGHVYSTTDGLSWASIDSGLSTTQHVVWVQYLDKIYYSDGAANVKSWDGTTLTGIAGIPKGRYFAIWRNRLWVSGVSSAPRRVYWSKAGDPTDFTTYALNTVDFPDDTEITALAAVQNVSAGADGSDGVLVFTKSKTHRIYDDTDNVSGAVIGGANTLVDAATGCLSHRSIAQSRGRLYFLARSGVYSTDGHNQAREETQKIAPVFQTFSWGLAQNFAAIASDTGYLLAYTPAGQAANTRVLEAFLSHQAVNGGHPWMAHSIAAQGFIEIASTVGDQIYLADASAGNTMYVRRLFTGGYDVTGDSSQQEITAFARTGAQLLGVNGVKRMRRIELFGKGAVTVSVSADLTSATGESGLFDMRSLVRDWDVTDHWGTGVWGGGGDPRTRINAYSKRGRYLTFELSEVSAEASTRNSSLGYAGGEDGGAAAYSMVIKYTPLDSDV